MATTVITVDNGAGTDYNVIGQELTIDALTGVAQYVREFSETATRSSVTAAASDTLILASNTARAGATIYNDTTDPSNVLYLGLGTTAASTTSFSVKIGPDRYYEVPYGFHGEIRGIWAVASGSARVTELT